MKIKASVGLAVAITVFSATALPAWAETLGAPIPGYTFCDGVYQPNEPWRQGQPRATGLQQAFPRMKSIEENPITPAKVSLGKLLYFRTLLNWLGSYWPSPNMFICFKMCSAANRTKLSLFATSLKRLLHSSGRYCRLIQNLTDTRAETPPRSMIPSGGDCNFFVH